MYIATNDNIRDSIVTFVRMNGDEYEMLFC